MPTRVAVLGAGNGGCAAAADLTRRGYTAALHSRSKERLQPIWERGGLHVVQALREAGYGGEVRCGDRRPGGPRRARRRGAHARQLRRHRRPAAPLRRGGRGAGARVGQDGERDSVSGWGRRAAMSHTQN